MAQRHGLGEGSGLIHVPNHFKNPLSTADKTATDMDAEAVVDSFSSLEVADLGDHKTVVVGIDFGTTYETCPHFSWAATNSSGGASRYSGVAWAVLEQAEWKPHVIANWPRPGLEGGVLTSPKVPSLVSYAQNDGTGHISWGFNAERPLHEWFKIQLDPSHDHAKKRGITPNSIATSEEAERTTVDYLRALWTHAESTLRGEMQGKGHRGYTFAVVLTVPAMWTLSAKEKTKSLALKAGIPGPIMMISEPEAAAIAAFQRLAAEDKLKVGRLPDLGTPCRSTTLTQHHHQEGDVFVVCDAGGGTVVSSHRHQVNDGSRRIR